MKKPSRKKKRKSTRRKPQPETRPSVVAKSEPSPLQEEKERPKRTDQPIAKRELERRGAEQGAIIKYVNIAMQFLRESRMELKKVKWPTRKELLASTAMVIFLVLVVAFFLGVIDFGLIKVIRNIVG